MDAHKRTWHQDTPGCRSMIGFVVVSSAALCFGHWGELSADHGQLVVSSVRWRGRTLDRSPRWTPGVKDSIKLNEVWYRAWLATGSSVSYFHLSVLMNEGRMEREVDRQFGEAFAMMQMLHWSVVVKRELSWKVSQEELGSNLCSSPGGWFGQAHLGEGPGQTWTHLRGYISQLAQECSGVLPGELEEVAGEKSVWAWLLPYDFKGR